jgi:hypothetical protein
MEISDVKKRVHETIERAKRRAAERRARTEAAGHEFGRFLEQTAIPLFRQVANVLRADRRLFSVFTPSGSVRLMSDRRSEDFVELVLDASGDEPNVVLHSSRAWGNRVIESERAIGDPANLTEDALLAGVLEELEPLVER